MDGRMEPYAHSSVVMLVSAIKRELVNRLAGRMTHPAESRLPQHCFSYVHLFMAARPLL